ncbi:hypothetical protein [Cryobacterium sp. PH31-O1]|uniref:hypothetical protein n=1 Tax=Cryobacterium sp. PH31-O1 TaxID=3046306 RepID=UPI0024BAFB43|nr:hypothetical protein [Cryobacterium sp. PH31-O1]MDJ0337304.1 hypothetical protein [Cryobacterium sp. PH31-O1]
MTTSTIQTPTTVKARRASKLVLISLWAVPVLVVGSFAMLAVVPVILVLIGAFREKTTRALRWWAIALTAVYATPLAIWILRADGAQSLSKDISPIFATLIVLVSVAFLVRIYTRKR